MTFRFRGAADRAGLRRLLILIVTAAVLASCAGTTRTGSSSSPAQSAPPRGGTLRIVVPSSPFTAELADPQPTSLDPQLGTWFSWDLLRCCLVRSLYSHNGRPTEEGGSRLYPDLAEELPEVSADGLTWTIRIKEGLHYGPPLEDVEITANDFVRSFKRLLAPSISVAEYGGWYGLFLEIEGATKYNSGETASISGLEAPDDHTLVFRLVQPEGDFGARLAAFAAGPLPPDPFRPDAGFGIAEGADAGYGRFLVSSGPFMVEASEKLDFSVPPTSARSRLREAATLVRNPRGIGRACASPGVRRPDRDRPADSVSRRSRIDAGTADLVWPSGATCRHCRSRYTPRSRPILRADASIDATAGRAAF
jgi:ABC-type transport system substrate-binding protein